MDRKVLVELLRNGMRYPVGRHQIWVSRCFEITVCPDKVIMVDEFESYDERSSLKSRDGIRANPERRKRMFHLGRSMISLKNRQVIENAPGAGWVDSDCSRDVLDTTR